MTKKHFNKIAEILHLEYLNGAEREEDCVSRIADNLGRYFEEMNSNFSFKKWNSAIFGELHLPF